MLQVICLMLHVICHILHIRNALHSFMISSKYISHVNLSHVTCNMTHFTYHMPFITCPWKCHGYMHAVLSAFNLCHISICHMSYVTCHMSLVTCHMSQVMCHMSYFTCSWTCYALFRVHDVGQIKWPYIGLPDSPKGQRSKNDPARCQGLTLKTKTNYEFLYIKKSGTTLKSLGNRGCDIWQ